MFAVNTYIDAWSLRINSLLCRALCQTSQNYACLEQLYGLLAVRVLQPESVQSSRRFSPMGACGQDIRPDGIPSLEGSQSAS